MNFRTYWESRIVSLKHEIEELKEKKQSSEGREKASIAAQIEQRFLDIKSIEDYLEKV